MSIKVISWVREHAPTENPAELCILYSLADRANDDGQGCWPSVATMAEESRCSERTVQRHLRNLEQRGVIRRGDQRLVERYRADRRPIVWDLNLSLKREDTGCQSVMPSQSRGDKSGTNGVTNSASRGDTVVTQTVSKPIIKPEGVKEAVTTGLSTEQDSQSPPQSLDELAAMNAAAASGEACPSHPYGNPDDVPCHGCRQVRVRQQQEAARREAESKGAVVRELRKRNDAFTPPEPPTVDKYPPGVAELGCTGCGASSGEQCVKFGKPAMLPCGERLRAAKSRSATN